MAKFDKLTDSEYKRLALLGKELQRIQEFYKEDILWTFMPTTPESFVVAEIPDRVQNNLATRIEPVAHHIEAHELHVKRWAEAGYISLSPSLPLGMHGKYSRFILTPRGVDYLKYRSHWPVTRWFIDAWSDLRTEIRSAIISIIVTIITAYLILQFNLK